MTCSFLQSGPVCRKNLFWLVCMPLLASLASCSPEEYATQKMDSFPIVSASLELAEQRITETTRLSKFLSNTDDVSALNMAIANHDKDGINRVLAKYGAFASRRYRPVDLATLVATNDTLPGSSIANRSSTSHLGFLYGIQLIGKGSGSTGSTTRMNYLEPFGYLTYSYDLPNNKGFLFGGLGAYAALGLWGRIKSGTYSANVFDSQSGYSRFDAGLALTAGYQLPQGLRLSLAREIGLLNINPNNPDEKVNNRVWSLNVAYPLRKLVALAKKK